MSLSISDLKRRSVDVFRELVDAYVETGEPVGSRTLSRRLQETMSPATIRNIMADLEEAGLLYAPHVSAGRLPTELGLRFFVHGILEIGRLSSQEQEDIQKHFKTSSSTIDSVLQEASQLLSGLSKCASVMTVPKTDSPLKHIEFISLGPGRVLVILVSEDGFVENRLAEIPQEVHPSSFALAARYLNQRLCGKTLPEIRHVILGDLCDQKMHIDELTAKVIEAGLAVWSNEEEESSLIVKGQSHLLSSVTELGELEHIKLLFQQLETKEVVSQILDASIKADGVQIFIGSDNRLFKTSGCSMVISPYHNANKHIIGAIGVIGPTRMNYSKIIPLVDYTAKIVGHLIGSRGD